MKHYQLTEQFRTNTSETFVLNHDLLQYPWNKKSVLMLKSANKCNYMKMKLINLYMSNEQQFYMYHRKDAAAAYVVPVTVSFCAWLVI
jgi:hypothetical protein